MSQIISEVLVWIFFAFMFGVHIGCLYSVFILDRHKWKPRGRTAFSLLLIVHVTFVFWLLEDVGCFKSPFDWVYLVLLAIVVVEASGWFLLARCCERNGIRKRLRSKLHQRLL